MADVWIPGWTRIDLGPDGGPYDETAHPKVCVHTTEGTTLAGAEAAYRQYPPHMGYDPVRRLKHQYVALNRYSYAFRNGETDDEYIVQVEVVGFAAKTHLWPNSIYANFAEDVVGPMENLIGVPRQHLRFYRADEGIVLARKTSPIRLRPAALREYSGWMGHQHAPGLADNGTVLPFGDEHWDPGGFLMDTAFSFMPRQPNKAAANKSEESMYILNNGPDGKRYAILTGNMFVGLGSPEEHKDADRAIAAGALYQWVETWTWDDFDSRSKALSNHNTTGLPVRVVDDTGDGPVDDTGDGPVDGKPQ